MLTPVLIDALHLHDDSIIHDKIHAKSFFEHHALVFEANDPLSLDWKALLLERAGQNCLVHGFHKTWTQLDMDPQRRIDDRSRDFIQISHVRAPPRLRGSARKWTLPR